MKPIAVIVRYQAKAAMQQRAAEEITALVELVVKERGCLGIDILQDPGDPCRLVLYERWTDKETYLGKHMQTPYILSFIQRAPEFLAGRPEISIWDTLSEKRGKATSAQ